MRRYERGPLPPANEGCYVCDSGLHLIDTEVIIQNEGQLLICVGCIISGARKMGYRLWSPEKEAELEDAKVRARNAEALQEVAEDAVIGLVTASSDIIQRTEEEAELVAKRNDGRNSRGQFVKQSTDA